jgi:hypothetical protein
VDDPSSGNIAVTMTYETIIPYGDEDPYYKVTSVTITNMSGMVVNAHGYISPQEPNDHITGPDEIALGQKGVAPGNSVSFSVNYVARDGIELIMIFHDLMYNISDAAAILKSPMGGE